MPGVFRPLTSHSVESLYSRTLLGASATSIDVQGIPATYSHMRVYMLLRTDQAVVGSSVILRFNNDSAGNYDRQLVSGNQAAASANQVLAQTGLTLRAPGSSGTASTFGVVVCDLPFYSGSQVKIGGYQEDVMFDLAAADVFADVAAFRWRSTAAINRLTLTPGGGTNLVAGSALDIFLVA